VGHQGSELLELTKSVRAEIDAIVARGEDPVAWLLYHRWLNEILSDFWAMAHLGITATNGLISVVSLPSYFVFRIATDAPHPFPWIRVKISIAIGRILFPHAQWDRLERQWEALYPTRNLPPVKRQLIARLEQALPAFASLLVNHRSAALRGNALAGLFPVAERQPERRQSLFRQWQVAPHLMEQSAPTLVFAVVGQARADDRITVEGEFSLLTRLLNRWALERAKHYGRTWRRPGRTLQGQPAGSNLTILPTKTLTAL
jgi:hypothetical protein